MLGDRESGLIQSKYPDRYRAPQLCGVAGGHPLTLDGGAGRCAVTERPAAQRFPTMRCQPVRQLRTLRHDPRRVDVGMHDVVVLVDLDEVDGVAKPGVWNRSRAQRMSRQLARPRYVTHQNLNSKMFYTPGWGAGRVECKRTVNRRRGFADEVATAIQRVNAIAELTRTR
jgi:hypothetical protein